MGSPAWNGPSRRSILLWATGALPFLAALTAGAAPPRNVILLIGDGMGYGQITMARLADFDRRLHMDSMPVAGHVQVAPAAGSVPDSAAAATAMASGHRTLNGRIGQLPDATPVPTLLEIAEGEGRSTGLVTNTTLTHATTASFAAHVENRGMEWEIASQMLASGADVLMGGGLAYFLPKSAPGSRRLDERDLRREAREAGFALVGTRSELDAAAGSRILGLFHLRGMTTEPPEPSLTEMALKALQVLSSDEDGFFLLVEGGQIDWACHDNDFRGALKQMRDFDHMVGAVLSLSRARDDTLVLVTADHETGGLMLLPPRRRSRHPFRVHWATGGHTATDVPLFAEGPGAERFAGALAARDIARRVLALWGLPFPGAGSD